MMRYVRQTIEATFVFVTFVCIVWCLINLIFGQST